MKLIPLTQGKFAQVDDADYDCLSQWKWQYAAGYAVRNKYIGTFDGKKKTKTFLMHREINKTPDGFETDHRDSDRLNNQRYNLRDATQIQNQRNREHGCGKSKYKGVSRNKRTERWEAKIKTIDKRYYLGSFNSETDAAISYNNAALKYFGEFARLNIIQ